MTNQARRAYRLFYFGIIVALIGTVDGALGVVLGFALREWPETVMWMVIWGLLLLLTGAAAMLRADRFLRHYQEKGWSK